ncbi:MAG: TRAP transporter small permease [Gammaproteobacteria bacterium]|nr:TRAP transporter small permease [Gammaproteobacteria bacterium]
MIPVLRFPVTVFHFIENTALVSSLLTMLILAIIQIVLRNFFDAGIYWAEPFLRMLVLWVALLGAMVATREHNHINIDAASRYLSPSARKVTAAVVSGISAVICGIVTWFGLELVLFEFEDQTIAFASVPTWITEVIIPVAFAVMAVRFLNEMIAAWIEHRP